MKSGKLTMTAAVLAGLGLAGASQAQTFDAFNVRTDTENVFSDGATVNVAGGTFTDSNPGDPDLLFTIDQSITLTADQWYNMEARVVVLPGATLTIEPGTVFGSGLTTDGATGSLIITPGAKIIAEGTADAPIIFTGRTDLEQWDDDATHPTGKDPRNRGQWRAGIRQWGSVAVLGSARISDTRQNPANPTAFDAAKTAPIEGLPNLTGNANFYGGLDDNDDSGVMRYVSLSYGGEDFDPTTDSELNGMSWGGTGRGFDASHIEIFNNVDDGLEIFGGTTNIRNLAIWNIGDDSLDVDQGWRGKVQFLLIVQGAAGEFNQGSGFGDNGIEADGADGDTAAQPVTAAAIWNATVIGAPEVVNRDALTDGDSADRIIALRDNANLQIWNSLFLTDGQNMLNNDGDDGDGSVGYGGLATFDDDGDPLTPEVPIIPGGNGTLTFAQRWTTTADWYRDPSNGFPNQGSATQADFEAAYTAQDPSANLLQISGSVWFQINGAGELINVGVLNGTGAGSTDPGGTLDNFVSANLPITQLVRADDSQTTNPFVIESSDPGDGVIGNILTLDPRAAGDALDATRAMQFQPPADGFYTTPTNFRGAVAPNSNWLAGWTGMSAFENLSGDKILQGTNNPAAPGNVNLAIAPVITFQSTAGVFYEVVAIDADGTQRIVVTIEGDGTVLNVADFVNAPLDASQKYIVRVSTL